MKFPNFKFQEKGFTLPEVMIAVFIILIGIIGISGVFPKIISLAGLSSLEFTASYLSQEGIELVRNIRDENLLNFQNWDDGLDEGDYGVRYDGNILLSGYGDVFLKIDSDGFYNYFSGGDDTLFKRKITIKKEDDNTILVTSSVKFDFKGKSYDFSAEEYLYQWLK